jgi:cell division protein FtsL
MSKKNQEEKHLNAKQKAYEQKQAKQGDRIVKWIIGILIALALVYAISSILIFS